MKRLILFVLAAALSLGAQTVSGSLTAASTDCTASGSCVGLALNQAIDHGVGAVGVGLTGTFNLTFQLEGSVDRGLTWSAVSCSPFAGGAAITSAAGTSAQMLVCDASGLTNFRVRCSAFTSGPGAVVLTPSSTNTAGDVNVGGGNVQVQGMAASGSPVAGNPVLVAGSDGTNARTLGVTAANQLVTQVSVAGADGLANTVGYSLVTPGGGNAVPGAFPHLFNGATWDRWRSTLLPGSASVTQQNSAGFTDPCALPSALKSSKPINITSATTTSLVAVSGSTAVYVCGFTVTISQVVTTPNTIQFEYGTGASCTGTTALTGIMGGGGVTAAAPITVSAGNGGSTIFTAPASNGICAVTAIGGSGSFQGFLTYVQQ